MRKQKGFTLIELLVVIAIIGLLSTLAVVALNSARLKSRDAKRVADIKQIQTALELHFNDEQDYPIDPVAGEELGVEPDCLDEDGFVTTCDAGGTTYMGLVPRDPSQKAAANACVALSAAPCNYAYNQISALQYEILFYLEGATGGLAAGISCSSEAGLVSGAACTH